MSKIPQPGQVWEHYSGNRFTVILIANEVAVDRDRYPRTVVFQDDLGRVWALSMYEFYCRFTLVDDIDMEDAAPKPAQQPLTDEHKDILKECRDQAMMWILKARIPESGAFSRIAQDLGYLCEQLGVEND